MERSKSNGALEIPKRENRIQPAQNRGRRATSRPVDGRSDRSLWTTTANDARDRRQTHATEQMFPGPEAGVGSDSQESGRAESCGDATFRSPASIVPR